MQKFNAYIRVVPQMIIMNIIAPPVQLLSKLTGTQTFE